MNVVCDKYNNVHKLTILFKSLKTEVIIKIIHTYIWNNNSGSIQQST